MTRTDKIAGSGAVYRSFSRCRHGTVASVVIVTVRRRPEKMIRADKITGAVSVISRYCTVASVARVVQQGDRERQNDEVCISLAHRDSKHCAVVNTNP